MFYEVSGCGEELGRIQGGPLDKIHPATYKKFLLSIDAQQIVSTFESGMGSHTLRLYNGKGLNHMKYLWAQRMLPLADREIVAQIQITFSGIVAGILAQYHVAEDRDYFTDTYLDFLLQKLNAVEFSTVFTFEQYGEKACKSEIQSLMCPSLIALLEEMKIVVDEGDLSAGLLLKGIFLSFILVNRLVHKIYYEGN